MTTVVFLRGMNLGTRRLTNEELVSVFVDAGYDGVSAYQASGNVILANDDSVEGPDISKVLFDGLGYEITVFVRHSTALTRIAEESPITGRAGTEGGKPQIVFLGDTTGGSIADLFPEGHEVHRIGSELHWLPPTGLSELGHVQRAMDARFGITTIRTLGTIERLVKRTN